MSKTLIIGASRGLGRGFVRQLVADGSPVWATARDDTALAELEGMGARSVRLDVSQPDSMKDFHRTMQEVEPDLVIHVAGVFGPRTGPRIAITRREFDDVMRTNVFGVMQWLPQLAPGLAARQGRAAFISSDMASIAECSSSHGMLYRASKAALNMVVKCAALEYPGARFLALSPGWVRTDMGGQEAPLSVEESVRGMLEVLSSLTPADSGSFLDHQRRNLPW